MKTILLAFTASLLLLSACDTIEIGRAKDVNPETVWQQYNVLYDEADDSVVCHAQFRFAGANGTSLILDSGSNLMLDNKLLQVDNSSSGGAYYLKVSHTGKFAGNHSFTYTDINGKKYENSFVFTPIILQDSLPESINPHSDLKLRFSGLADNESVNISLSDTAYSEMNLDSNFVLSNQSIIIPASCIAKMTTGPLKLQVEYEKKLPLQQTAKEGGEINFVYALKPRMITLGTSWE